MIISIDGPSGVGKSTISKIIAKELNITYIDTGAMYRGVTYFFLKNNIQYSNLNNEQLSKILNKIDIELTNDKIFLNKEDVTNFIRTKDINSNVSKVSEIGLIREKLVTMQRNMGKQKSIIMDGRDIGSVVFKNADYKFYLDASVEVRAKRRYNEEKEKGLECNFKEIKNSIINRDNIDKNRMISPLIIPDGAIIINTDNLNINQVKEKILSHIK